MLNNKLNVSRASVFSLKDHRELCVIFLVSHVLFKSVILSLSVLKRIFFYPEIIFARQSWRLDNQAFARSNFRNAIEIHLRKSRRSENSSLKKHFNVKVLRL